MRVEAIRTDDGLLIPMQDGLKDLDRETVLLDIQIVEPEREADYAPLDRLVGLCETGRTDASVNHDTIIYGRGEPDGLR